VSKKTVWASSFHKRAPRASRESAEKKKKKNGSGNGREEIPFWEQLVRGKAVIGREHGAKKDRAASEPGWPGRGGINMRALAKP